MCSKGGDDASDEENDIPAIHLESRDSSEWHHMQCGSCKEWWAIEGPLSKKKYFCTHCGRLAII